MKNQRLASILACCVITAACTTTIIDLRPDEGSSSIFYEDAERFIAMFEQTNGKPGRDVVQAQYIEKGTRGVEIFTPHRIIDAANLQQAISQDPASYKKAIEVCYPLAREAEPELKDVYSKLQAIFPERTLPDVYFVFGAGNSGGTATEDAQVLGLEVLCGGIEGDEEFLYRLRMFFAHEPVHSFQPESDPEISMRDILLHDTLREGVADFVASLVVGGPPSPERDKWARENEALVKQTWLTHRQTLIEAVQNGVTWDNPTPEAIEAWGWWLANSNTPPEGWPPEMGYWVGRQIVQRYVENASDRKAALDAVIELKDPHEIVVKSGYFGDEIQ